MRELEEADFYLLSGIEHGMRFSEWVDRRKLPKFSGLSPEEVDHRLDRCQRKELIRRKTMQYEGYQLLFEGYDALALRAFSEREVISAVGAPIGEGKESDVLEATNGSTYAIKFHREGLTNFRRVDRERDYTADREHVSWLYTARKAAEREFEVMDALYPHARVPEPIDQNRHAMIMERLDGSELARSSLSDDVAPLILTQILEQLATVYEHGFIHTDASEYNTIISANDIWFIDWPQAVSTDHPNAEELLSRDVSNLVNYFQRKHPHLFDTAPDIQQIMTHVQEDSIDTWAETAYT